MVPSQLMMQLMHCHVQLDNIYYFASACPVSSHPISSGRATGVGVTILGHSGLIAWLAVLFGINSTVIQLHKYFNYSYQIRV